MAQLLEHALYNALLELREAEKALRNAVGLREKVAAAERVILAEIAADELLAVTTNDYEQVAEQFGADFVMRD